MMASFPCFSLRSITIICFIFSNFVSSFSSIYEIHSSGLNLAHTNNSSTIIFLSGFPDTSKTWSPLLPAFQDQYHIVTLALPDYESDSLKSFWGYSIQNMVDELAQIARELKNQGSPLIYLVGHDWGAHLCLCLIDSYANAKLVDKVILLDVGLRSKKDLLMDLTSLSYMSYLATAFLISRLSNAMATWFVLLYPWNLIGPCRHSSDSEYAANNFSNLKGFMTYPYLQVLFSNAPAFHPEVPQLFLFGSEKATMFHSNEYLNLLETTPSCYSRRMVDCGHWCHWTKSQEIVTEIKMFLQTSGKENDQPLCSSN